MGISRQTKGLIHAALREDAPRGDITSKYFGSRKTLATARLIAKENGIVCGMEVAAYCFQTVKAAFTPKTKDGDRVKKGMVLATIKGRLNDLLLAERTALNLLQHLSGIATETYKLSRMIKSTGVMLLDTRKTTPGLRELEKYAVAAGGGQNHRRGLSDMVLIKDNHLAGLTPKELPKRLERFARRHKKIRIEIEAASFQQVKDFLRLPVDIIMLDNLPASIIRKAVKLRDRSNPDCRLEASGRVTVKNILPLAKTGVDYISCGWITHSAPALDISMLIKNG